MQDLNDKITGGTLTATEWNEVPSEIQNVIEAFGITLSSGDLNQLGKALAAYVANGDFYIESGIANAYVAGVVGSRQAITSYFDGMRVRFITANANTIASTINVSGLGVKNIKTSSGANLVIGKIQQDIPVELYFDLANDQFILDESRYNNTTIVGTTSESSGIPTGAIIERGSNANGEFTRFADGTQICYIRNIAVSAATTVWTFPAVFLTFNFSVQATPNLSTEKTVIPSGATLASAILNAYDGTGTNTLVSAAVQAIAIGRWY